MANCMAVHCKEALQVQMLALWSVSLTTSATCNISAQTTAMLWLYLPQERLCMQKLSRYNQSYEKQISGRAVIFLQETHSA